jgi:predicted tellurium resistance membrane protein TerC
MVARIVMLAVVVALTSVTTPLIWNLSVRDFILPAGGLFLIYKAVMEGLHKHVPKAFIYLPMGFALLVEVLQMHYEHNRRKRLDGTSD